MLRARIPNGMRLMLPVILSTVVLAYLPALCGGFIWDDDAHITAPSLRSLSGLWRIWFEVGATQQYYPLLHSAFWLEHRLWGNAPLGYHLANVGLHAGTAFLFFLTLRRLAIPGALLAALIFALHPVHVESVAWITEQKNTLSTLFYLAAALVYLRFDTTRKNSAYFLALFFFILGLLTKTVTATLPAALLVVFWWQRGRLSWKRDVLPLLPWLAVGAIAGLFTAHLERALIGAEGAAFDLSFVQRLLLAGRAVFFYVGQLYWPTNLIFIYPRWNIDDGVLWQWLPLGLVLVVIGALWIVRKHSRAPLAAGLLFIGSLFPVLGFFNVYPFIYSFVADHFQYLASLSLIAFASAVLARLSRPLPMFIRWAGSALLCFTLSSLTWRQSQIYRNPETLYRATIAANPACWMALNNLGKEFLGNKTRLPEAIGLIERALALRPDYFEARNNLGLALTQSGRPLESIPHFQQALQLKPRAFQTHNNLGIALASSGRVQDALASFAHAAELNPTLPNIQENWAKALLLLGRNDEAQGHFARASLLRSNQNTSLTK